MRHVISTKFQFPGQREFCNLCINEYFYVARFDYELFVFICLGWGCAEQLVSAASSSSAPRTPSRTDVPAIHAPTLAYRLQPPNNNWENPWAVQRAFPMTSLPVARWQRSSKALEVVLDSSRAVDLRSFLEVEIEDWEQWSDEVNEIITDCHNSKTPNVDFLAVLLASHDFRCPKEIKINELWLNCYRNFWHLFEIFRRFTTNFVWNSSSQNPGIENQESRNRIPRDLRNPI